MKLCIVMPSASLTGGSEEALCQFLKSDASRCHQLQVLFLENGPLVSWSRKFTASAHVIACGRTREIWRWWRAASRVMDCAVEFEADLIFGWMTKGQVYGGLAALRSGIPNAWYQHGIPENALMDKIACILPSVSTFACSQFVARLQRLRKPRSSVVAISPGVDLTRFSSVQDLSIQAARELLNLPTCGPLIGTVGRLQAWKGMHLIIAALPSVLEKYPNLHCVIVGGQYPAEPDYPNQLRQQAASLSLQDKITFAGAQSNVPLWMQAMDVFLHLSDREPFGLVVAEAISLGKRVLSCRPGGSEEILHGLPGCSLLDTRDPKIIADSIIELLESDDNWAGARRDRATMLDSEVFAKQLWLQLEKLI